ncbi:MAG: hypothetical protein JNL58_30340 [Planctomyces sp.]|nr:hypothetical protein [Planctomyces sp.]
MDSDEQAGGQLKFEEVLVDLILFTFGGGIVGFVGYFVLAIIFEGINSNPVRESSLSYGQQSILVSLPLCTVVGLGIGVAAYLASLRQRLVSSLLFLFVGGLGMAVNFSLWSQQVAQSGRDRSEAILYHPPLALCMLSLSLGIWMLCLAVRRRSFTKTAMDFSAKDCFRQFE